MNIEQAVLSVLSFIVNSILLTGFIIPQAQKVNEIKDKMHRFRMISPKEKAASVLSPDDWQNERTKYQAHKLNNLFDTYRIKAKELNSIVKIFIGSVILALIALMLFLLKVNPALVLILHTLIQMLLLIWAIKLHAFDPDGLQKANYLFKHLLINPHSLINALSLDLFLDSDEFLKPFNKDTPIKINCQIKLRVLGFRYLFMVFDSDERVFYVSFGYISSESQIQRHFMNPNDLFEDGEFQHIEIGQAKLNLIKTKKDITLELLIFLPYFKNEQFNPYKTSQEIEAKHLGGVSAFSSSSKINSNIKTEDIIYAGGNGSISLLKYTGKNKKSALNRVIDKYGKNISKTKKMSQYFDLTGNLV